MKLILLLQLVIFGLPLESIYDISFESISGEKVAMSAFKGKRILIASFDATNPSSSQFRFLDSLQQRVTDIQIIAVPVIDSLNNEGKDKVQAVKNATKSSIIIAQSARINRRSENLQHSLFNWLTDVKKNSHFNADGLPGQYYVVSQKGTLYAMLEPGAPDKVVLNILNIKFDESNHYIYNPETKYYEPQK